VGETIFLIDDDRSVREGLTSLIESVGFSVQTFPSALEFLALDPLQAEGCLILDVEMPGMNGLELQRKMNSSGICLPVIFLTGHGDIPMTVEALKAGAVHFLTKPVREDALMNAIRQALEHDRNTRSERAEVRKVRERFDLLAPRERQVMRLVVSGRLNKQIAYLHLRDQSSTRKTQTACGASWSPDYPSGFVQRFENVIALHCVEGAST
jgi:FixJ family two-component response regulator